MVARKIRAHDGDMQGEREPSLPACFSVYNEVFNSNSHWVCLPIVLCHYSNCLSVLNVLPRWLKSFDCKLYVIFHFFFPFFLFATKTSRPVNLAPESRADEIRKIPDSKLQIREIPNPDFQIREIPDRKKTYREPSTEENQSWNWRNEVRVTLSR